jgi:hypothetical protein
MCLYDAARNACHEIWGCDRRIAPHVTITLVMLEAIKTWEKNVGL